MKRLFEGIYSDGKSIYTKNLLEGKKVYGERLVKDGSVEYREWDSHRSKYCAALMNGLKQSIFFSGAKVLYLGSAEGTTVSHVSDIVGSDGLVLGVDVSEIAMQKLLKLAEQRENILPILADAQSTKDYEAEVREAFGPNGCDALFQDISQRNQADIFVRNSRFLKLGGFGAIAIKTKSISQAKRKEDVLAEEKKALEKEFEVLQVVNLEPYEKEHYLVLVRKR